MSFSVHYAQKLWQNGAKVVQTGSLGWRPTSTRCSWCTPARCPALPSPSPLHLTPHAQVTPSDAFIHPFDHEMLWDGHASLIDEVVEAGVTPDAVVRRDSTDKHFPFET